MKDVGLEPKEFYITNAVLHGPPDNNRAPNAAAVRSCSGVLLSQIDAEKPRLIVTFGMHAYRAICIALGKRPHTGNLSNIVGRSFEIGGSTIYPTYHLSPFNFNVNGLEPEIKLHWKEIVRIYNALGRRTE